MGAGASLGNELGGLQGVGGKRFYCHSCHRNMMYRGDGDDVDPEPAVACPYCQSTFMEEIEHFNPGNSGNSEGALGAGVDLEQLRSQRRDLESLSSDQARRLANAAIMLRLLEHQLQGELRQLQSAYSDAADTENQPMSPIMKKKLRKTKMEVDLICSQPSCPICSEDFLVGNCETTLPCGHAYHESCVVPWLDMKKTCPICRYELTDAVPTVEELERLTLEELQLKKEEEEEEEGKMSVDKKKEDGEMEKLVVNSETEDIPTKRKLATDIHDLMQSIASRKVEVDKSAALSPLRSPLRQRLEGQQPSSLEQRLEAVHRQGNVTAGQPSLSEIFGENITMRSESERRANPSSSNRTLRELMNEEEEHQARRQRILQQVRDAENSVPDFLRAPSTQRSRGIIQTQPRQQQHQQPTNNEDFMRSIGSILSNSNMGLGEAASADDDDQENNDSDGEETDNNSRSDISVTAGETINAPFPMSHATGRVASLGGIGGGIMPRTFIIRNGNVEERRIVMREAVEEEASGTVA